MRRPSFNDQLRKAFLVDTTINHKPGKNQRANFLKTLEILHKQQEQTLLTSLLKQFHRAPRRTDQERIKSVIFEAIHQIPQRNTEIAWQIVSVLPRKLMATGFAVILLLPAFFGPLQLFQSEPTLPTVRAAYIECSGKVYLNQKLCVPGELSTVSAGDSISTDAESFATIFFNDSTLARLNSASDAIVDNLYQQRVQLLKGGVWLHSQGSIGRESLKVSTSALKAQVTQGSAGVVVKGTTTQLFTTNSALEVQIDNPSGTTKLLTLAPEKKLTVRKSLNKSNVTETPLDRTQQNWVRENTTKDVEYVSSIKKKSVDESLADVRPLPGSAEHFVGNATQSARIALTLDENSKFEQNLRALDSIFAETLVLISKGDKTIAETNFEAYSSKFTSLVDESSVSIEIGNEDQNSIKLLGVLQKHAQLLSPFSPQDPQYSLKSSLQKLAVDLDPNLFGPGDSEKIVADVSLNKLLEANKAIVSGNLGLAREMLSDLLTLVTESPSSLSDAPSDLALLDTITEKSPELSGLALEIKKKKLEQMRVDTPQRQPNEIVGSTIVGTAYKTTEGEESNDSEETMTKVVGQAVKEDDFAL